MSNSIYDIFVYMEKHFPKATPHEIMDNDRLIGYIFTLGEKGNPPLLLIPGFTGTHKDVLNLANYLKEKYYVIIPDLPGWGKSPRLSEPQTITAYAKFIKQVLDYLAIPKIIICGHCMGALVAIETAILCPQLVQEILLISTPYLAGTFGHKILTFLTDISLYFPKKLRRIFFLWRSRVFTTPLFFYIIRTKSFKNKLSMIRYYFKIQPSQNEESLEENFLSISHYDFEKIKLIKIPICLIQGEQDVLIGKRQFDRLCDLAPNAASDLLPKSGHMPTFEATYDLSQLILKHLS